MSDAKTIFKYPLHQEPVGKPFTVDMPGEPWVFTAQAQGGHICLWAMVTPSEPTRAKSFMILGTGHPVPDDVDPIRFIATVQLGPLVWHVFELPPPK